MKRIWDIIRSKPRTWFGSRYKVYRQCDVEYIMKLRQDYQYILELATRCKLVYNDDQFRKKCISHYNKQVDVFIKAYPDVYEFHCMKKIDLT